MQDVLRRGGGGFCSRRKRNQSPNFYSKLASESQGKHPPGGKEALTHSLDIHREDYESFCGLSRKWWISRGRGGEF